MAKSNLPYNPQNEEPDAYDADGNVTTKTVNYKGLKLTNANYKLVAKDAESKEETDGTQYRIR